MKLHRVLFLATAAVAAAATGPDFEADGPELCPGGVCPIPEEFAVEDGAESSGGGDPAGPAAVELPTLDGFEAVRSVAGDVGPEKFVAFLRGGEPDESAFAAAMRRGGAPLLVLALLFAGLLLNLTPCTLPLVPVNLALLGIGTGRASRGRGALVGTAFGAGMAASYGALGLVAARTGGTFGAINGSAAFPAAVAIVFALLALATLGAFRIDFSRLRNILPRRSRVAAPRRGNGAAGLAAAFAAGAGSAVLAGACVAPALVSALVLSADLWGRGIRAGALVPFALGLGMALPWPFMGAGMAALPKPGRWTERVKHLFAAVFAAVAAVYLARAWALMAPDRPRGADGGGIAWLTDESAAAVVSGAVGKPILADFTADWCSACREMEKSTFADPAVRAAVDELHGPAVLRIDCTDTTDPRVRELLSRFGVPGLPFCAVLERAPAPPPERSDD